MTLEMCSGCQGLGYWDLEDWEAIENGYPLRSEPCLECAGYGVLEEEN